MKSLRSNPLLSLNQPCWIFAFFSFFAWTGLVSGKPFVVGYERFHADTPTVEGGALLFSELGCANCHGGSTVVIPRKGPSLMDLAQRVDREWITAFLQDPQSGRKGSTMPAMAHGLSPAEVDAVISYLGTLGNKVKFAADRHANAERGSSLYHEKGCVACHAPTPDFHSPHGGGSVTVSELAISHPDLKKKTSFVALSYFLTDPSKYRTDGRMPHLPLDRQEALDIAAHLLDYQGSDPRELPSVTPWPKADAAKIKQGKDLITKQNCSACHDLPGIKASDPVPLSGVPKEGVLGCLSGKPIPGIPWYELSAEQRQSLVKFLGSERPGADSTGHLTLAAMNCYACHDRDKIGGPTAETNPFFVGDEGLGDSGRLAPPLTGIGHKLLPDWMEGVFTGAEGSRVRPYLKTSMPVYLAQAKPLTEWLQKIDGNPKAKPIVQVPDLEAGRKLLGIQGGVNCITCHNWAERRSLGIPALDLSSLDKRLRPEWFREYLLDPAGYRAGTLMPPLWPGGKSSVPDVLGGDTEKQIGAIWSFIRDGEGVPEGFPEHAAGQFELIPKDRAIIQRTFLEGVGTKAILVGFPGGINLAFDGSSGYPALVWRGAFFDAYNTWFSRFAPFEKPLSDEVYAFPESGPRGTFRGYELDASGNPTFLLKEGEREVKEHYAVIGETLVRTVTWSGGAKPEIAHPAGVQKEEKSGEGILTIVYSWK
ncbi:MAG TPA: cytochrome c [Verrucomicrobiales bacterium]|nr:cytochrome c [Verrucomicrobiales bacterium]